MSWRVGRGTVLTSEVVEVELGVFLDIRVVLEMCVGKKFGGFR